MPAPAEYAYFVFGNERVARVTSGGTGNTPSKIYPGEATYFLYDHLGNTRVAFNMTDSLTVNTVYCGDYYPYGKVLREYDNGNGDRYLTTMHERDDETGLDYRGARYYDSDVARFLSLDPLAREFPSMSPYNYVAGNPVILVDPDGKAPTGHIYVYNVTYDRKGNKHVTKSHTISTKSSSDNRRYRYFDGKAILQRHGIKE